MQLRRAARKQPEVVPSDCRHRRARFPELPLGAGVACSCIVIAGSHAGEPGTSASWARRPPQGRAAAECLSRSEEHTSELQSLMRISYAVFCLKKKNKTKHTIHNKSRN